MIAELTYTIGVFDGAPRSALYGLRIGLISSTIC